MGALIAVLVVFMDTTFSVVVTMLFVLLINRVLQQDQVTVGHRRMQKTKMHTFLGSTLAVASSTVLYVVVALNFIVKGPFWSIPWLNVFVFGMNLDSIFNDIGMLLVSDMLILACFKSPRIKSQRVAPNVRAAENRGQNGQRDDVPKKNPPDTEGLEICNDNAPKQSAVASNSQKA
jgi:hypothetical protein